MTKLGNTTVVHEIESRKWVAVTCERELSKNISWREIFRNGGGGLERKKKDLLCRLNWILTNHGTNKIVAFIVSTHNNVSKLLLQKKGSVWIRLTTPDLYFERKPLQLLLLQFGSVILGWWRHVELYLRFQKDFQKNTATMDLQTFLMERNLWHETTIFLRWEFCRDRILLHVRVKLRERTTDRSKQILRKRTWGR